VKGNYEYYHYKHDGYSDEGWGCAYRSLQTLFSWFLINGFKKEGVYVPSILDIQKTLVKVGDKPAKIIDSNDWIGAFEVSIVLNELLGIESQIMFVSSGADLENKGRDLILHFETHGTPIMIGGGVYAYTILGVEYDRVKGKSMFLILDPHYNGADDIKTIISKGWCSWKDSSLFKKEDFYNLCLPQIPK
jgi:Ufm1-specific protease 2